MKILITGASGNVGSYVVKELLKLNEEVVAAGTNKEKLEKMLGDSVDIVKLDFTKPETFKNALIDIDRVF